MNWYRVFIKYCVFFQNIFRTLTSLGFHSVYTMTDQTPALQQKLQSSEKHNILRKNTIFNEHPVQPTGTE